MKTHNRRQHKRFSATAFLNLPVYLDPLPPYFGHRVKGKLIDLSAGGMAILINEVIPQENFFTLATRFPDGTQLECMVKVRHSFPRGRNFLHGIEFMSLSQSMGERIEKMSSDYIDCEARIQRNAQEICRADCAFFDMCAKPEKLEPVVELNNALELHFEPLKSLPSLPQSSR